MTDSWPDSTPLVHSPAQASKRLGVSASTLRRMAATYEALLAPLPRDDANGRVYTEEVLTTLGQAQVLREGGAASLEAALMMLTQDGGALDETNGRLSAQALTHLSERDETGAELLLELRTLTQALTDLNGQLRVQNERLEALERAPKWWQLRFWKALLKAQRGA